MPITRSVKLRRPPVTVKKLRREVRIVVEVELELAWDKVSCLMSMNYC